MIINRDVLASRDAEDYLNALGKGYPIMDRDLSGDDNYERLRRFSELHAKLTLQQIKGEPMDLC